MLTRHAPTPPRRFVATLAPLALCMALGCGSEPLPQDNGGPGTNNGTVNDNNTPTPTCPTGQTYDAITKECFEPIVREDNNSPIGDGCSDASKFVYAVDATEGDYSLLKFNPTTSQFNKVGALSCPAPGGASPFSMSVDRDARAWVLYSDGSIYLVDTTTASCAKSGFRANQEGLSVFGMGFVLESEGDDVLYIAGGEGINTGGSAKLASVSSNALTVNPLANLSGWPELTGTALGDLWAFFPGGDQPRVSKISRANGSESTTYPIRTLGDQPNAWAFAAWGGDFYLFYKDQQDDSSRVFKLETSDGAVTEVNGDTGYYIVGAGVSTCAPTIEIPL